MRAAGAVLVGFILISFWSVAFVSENAHWLAWVEGAAGLLAVLAAFGLVRESRAARALLALDAAVLFAAALVASVSATPVWLSWSSFGCGSGLALVSLPRRFLARFSTRVRTP